MTPIIFDTEWLLEFSITDSNPIWTKLRRYFWDRRFEVPYTPLPGMITGLYSFLDDSFSEAEKNDIAGYTVIVEQVCMMVGHLLIFVEGTRLLPVKDAQIIHTTPNP